MKNTVFRLAGLALILLLGACTSILPNSQERDYLPGGTPYYSFGISQSKDNFANVEKAQFWYGLYTKQKHWSPIEPAVAPGAINMLQSYYPLSVRWQLKEGQQFIAENIDVREIMREYFRSHDLKLPWQVQRRPMDGKGDYEPSLVVEIKDDAVIIKWHIRINNTPVSERFTPSGAANRWKISREEFVVTTVKGISTNGINFEKQFEIVK